MQALESEMKAQALWSAKIPDNSALDSTEPFACDKLTFSQWLQFVFIPKFTAMIKAGQPMPSNMAIGPAAQVWLQDQLSIQQLLNELDQRVHMLSAVPVNHP